jgi:hypothetical protein
MGCPITEPSGAVWLPGVIGLLDASAPKNLFALQIALIRSKAYTGVSQPP